MAQPEDAVVEVTCTFSLRPSAAVAAGGAPGGVGVGEVGGAHWFAKAEDGGPSAVELATDGAPHSAEGEACVSVVYRVYSSGVIGTDWVVDATRCLPALLPPGLHK